jgi:hypothetical protein
MEEKSLAHAAGCFYLKTHQRGKAGSVDLTGFPKARIHSPKVTGRD